VEQILEVGECHSIVKTFFVMQGGIKNLHCYSNYGFNFIVAKFS
jgi:hypothetical protein